MEVTNRFKGLDLMECLKNYGQRFVTLYRRQGSRPSPKKKKCKEAKWLSEEALQIAEKRREAKGKEVKNAKKQRKTIEWERLEISSRELEIRREHFIQRWVQ